MVFWKRSKGDDIRDLPTPSTGGRPKLKAAFTEELRASVRNLEDHQTQKNSSRFGFLGTSKKEGKSPGAKSPFRFGGRPKLSKEQKDELQTSVRNLMSRGEDEIRRECKLEETTTRRPTLNQAMADELRMSLHNREEKKGSRREEIRGRRMKRRESQRMASSAILPDSIREEHESNSQDGNIRSAQHAYSQGNTERPRHRPELFDELKKSIHDRSTRKSERRQQIKQTLLKRRESKRLELSDPVPDASSHSMDLGASFASDGIESFSELGKRRLVPGRRNGRKKKKKWDASQHSVDTFNSMTFSDLDGSDARLVHGASRQNEPISILESFDEDGIDGDFDSYKAEWSRLIRENKKFKSEAYQNKKKFNTMIQQVKELKSEGTDLRKQLSNWQEKASKISKRQSQERLNFENSTELIAKARVDLTKTLNEKSMLKTKLHELESGSDRRERRIRSLTETVGSQSNRVDELASRLRDTEVELRYNINEKRRIEEELSVIVASRDGIDIGETIRRLEEGKAQWLEEKERALEAKRMALDEENEGILEREKKKYIEEANELFEVSEKTKLCEEEQRQIQKTINRQIKDMKEANQDLQNNLHNEHMENRVETKKKDHTIALLEHEVSKLRRKLAASQLREQENERRQADIEDAKDAFFEARKQNLLLEKKIKKLKKGTQKQTGDWKEVILPGYRNLRGVTFGAPTDELAGFLTILVEDQKTRKSRGESKLQKEIKRYLKDPKKQNKEREDARRRKKRKSSRREMDRKEKTGKHRKKSVREIKQDQKKKKMKSSNKYDQGGTKGGTKKKARKRKSKMRSRNRKRDTDSESSEESECYDWSKYGHSASAHRKREKRKHKKSKRKDTDGSTSADGSTSYNWVKKNKNKKKSGIKASKRGKNGGRRVVRRSKLDENLALMDHADPKSKKAKQKAIDEVSLVVMKRVHSKRKTKQERAAVDGRRSHRLPSVVPPATIILQ